ncbi:MAG: YdeI/OmpD-associated family protein [Thermodesulfobacteriota bacterium]
MKTQKELPIIKFVSAEKWGKWLSENHAESTGIWLRFFKKDSGKKTVTYAEALDEALCYGWIDGQVKKYDSESWLQKFTPRRSKSIWSKRNKEHVARLTELKKMKLSGLKEIEAAKADGRWDQAYDSPKNMVIPEDFLKELSKNKKAKAFFETLNKTNTYSIAWRLQTAKKPETRKRRMEKILEMLSKGEKFHG